MSREQDAGLEALEYELFFRKSWKRVLGLTASRVGPCAAEDVAAECMMTAWSRWSSRPADADAVLWWVLAIAKNKSLHEWRGRDGSARLGRAVAQSVSTGVSVVCSAESVALSRISLLEGFGALRPSDRKTMLGLALQGGGGAAGFDGRKVRAGALAMRRCRARVRLVQGME